MLVRYLTCGLMVLVIILSFLPKVAGDLNDLYYVGNFDSLKVIPVKGKVSVSKDSSNNLSYIFTDSKGFTSKVSFRNSTKLFTEFERTKIFKVDFNSKSNKLFIESSSDLDFPITYPFIPGLEERARIILFHVPVAWISVLAFLVSTIFGILYLKRKNPDDDLRSVTSASLGLLFCILATITGSIWAKFNWGSFWNWDPRETSIFILLIIYGAYFALRSAIEIEEKKATLSSIYSILAFVTVPFFIFIMPRITAGLHPGSADDVSSPSGGPVLVKSGMSFEMRMIFFLSLFTFSLLYYWLFNLKFKIEKKSLKERGSHE